MRSLSTGGLALSLGLLVVAASFLFSATAQDLDNDAAAAPEGTPLLTTDRLFPEPALSPRNANYVVHAILDPQSHRISGRLELTWTNIQDVETAELPFHLYWNAWRNDQSWWMIESATSSRRMPRGPKAEEDWGWQQLERVRLLRTTPPPQSEPERPRRRSRRRAEAAPPPPAGPLDLTSQVRFAPPPEAPEDRTVAVLPLPQPVPPGGSVTIEIQWSAQVPRTVARTGRRGENYFLAHWLPKVGVFEGEEGWNCLPFDVSTEFFSDFGTYDVRLTLPQRFVVGATGRRVTQTPSLNGQITHRFVEADIHGFTWTASPDYLELEQRFEVIGLPPVQMRLLLQPEHRDQAQRHFDATAATLELYGRWYGPYPYPQITIVDPAFGTRFGGMEYPTIFTSGSSWLNPQGGGSPEGVTIHEAGHQFWYGIVANNEFEHAWLDEGLNTFSTARVYEEAFGERAHVERFFSIPGSRRGVFPLLFDSTRYSRRVHGNRLHRFRPVAAVTEAPSQPTYTHFPGTASAVSYHKPSLWLATLENLIGWESLQRILSTFFERYSYAHPSPEDFFAVAAEVAQQDGHDDLSWFFDQVYGSDVTFDYEVVSAKSRPAAGKGLFEQPDGSLELRQKSPEEEAPSHRSEVIVRRRGQGTFPVEVELRFEDGSSLRRSWDGQARWQRFVEISASPLVAADVDPDRVLLLDLDATNNQHRVEPASRQAAAHWGTRWLLWLQDLTLATTAYF
ncbi:MAG: M1 family aminopeptidase [Acidobacteriota bacterium]